MIQLTIDGRNIEVTEGISVLDAAQSAGVEIPTLCYTRRTGAVTSCMVCVVKDLVSGRMIPACSAKAAHGMQIDTRGPEVYAARQEILRLLLNEHAGDCEGPCTEICSASLNIPRMLRAIAAGDIATAVRIAKRDLIFPATLGYLCTAPCEKACRRGVYDTPLTIRVLHRDIAQESIHTPMDPVSDTEKTGKTVAVVGAGIAGLSAACVCLQAGHSCRVYEREALPCLAIRGLAEGQWPQAVLDAEIESIRTLGAEFVLQTDIGKEMTMDALLATADAIIVACAMPFTPHPNIFHAREDAMLVRSVAHGKNAARHADHFLREASHEAPLHRYNSQIGRLHGAEKEAYAHERLRPAAAEDSNQNEAVRCLHCDCLKPVSCKLRQYADAYGLGPKLKRTMTRPALDPVQRGGNILFDPGKCIKCGICVELCRLAGGNSGMTFQERGFDTRVRVPFGELLDQGLGECAEDCVKACPTGALAFHQEEETS